MVIRPIGGFEFSGPRLVAAASDNGDPEQTAQSPVPVKMSRSAVYKTNGGSILQLPVEILLESGRRKRRIFSRRAHSTWREQTSYTTRMRRDYYASIKSIPRRATGRLPGMLGILVLVLCQRAHRRAAIRKPGRARKETVVCLAKNVSAAWLKLGFDNKLVRGRRPPVVRTDSATQWASRAARS
jgi:hypothetical protein